MNAQGISKQNICKQKHYNIYISIIHKDYSNEDEYKTWNFNKEIKVFEYITSV